MGKKSGDKPKPSKQEKALAAVAEKKFEVYKRLYRPLAKKQLAATAATPGRIKEAQGIVNADVQQGAAGRDAGINAAGLAAGFDNKTGPSSRVLLGRTANANAIATQAGEGSALAREGVERREREGKLSHISLGHGIARDSMQSLTGLARNATAESIQRSRIKTDQSNQFVTTLGNAAGLAYGLNPDAFSYFGGGGTPGFQMSQLSPAGTGRRGDFAGGRSMR